MDLWGAQAITATTTGNQLQVFVGSPQLTETAKAILGAFGGVSGIAGALLVLRHKLGHKLGQKRGFQWLLVVVAVVFFLLLSIVISWVLVLIRSRSWMQSFVKWFYNVADLSFLSLPAWRVELFVAFFLTAVLLFFGIVMGFFIDTNRFSLHATYRNRLIRAYLAASRVEDTRKENPFTGFDPKDDFELHELCSQKPLHVINATLNLVKGKELAWQERQGRIVYHESAALWFLASWLPALRRVWQGYYTGYRVRHFGRRGESQYGIPFLARGRFPDDAL